MHLHTRRGIPPAEVEEGRRELNVCDVSYSNRKAMTIKATAVSTFPKPLSIKNPEPIQRKTHRVAGCTIAIQSLFRLYSRVKTGQGFAVSFLLFNFTAENGCSAIQERRQHRALIGNEVRILDSTRCCNFRLPKEASRLQICHW